MTEGPMYMQVQAVIDERTTLICLHAAGMIEPVGPAAFESIGEAMLDEDGVQRTTSPEDWLGVELPMPEGNQTQHGVADQTLMDMARSVGYDGLPQMLTREQYEDLLAAGAEQLFRGVSPIEGMTAEEMVKQFLSGEMFMGRGVFGNGMYFEVGDDPSIAAQYAGAGGKVMQFLVDPSARFIRSSELTRQQSRWTGEWMKLTDRQNELNELMYAAGKAGDKKREQELYREWSQISDEREKVAVIARDPGRFALMLGYDGIEVDTVADRSTYRVVLNRGVLRYVES